ncbi:MAG: rRNA pseudouridine synthase [Deltaproteobacteria bacterium]|nr:rRNA pseudouridine synthase [Deltaproteobacteria bacterium]MBW2308625.1 rRNA pseudouridine synthase [Deltaproteobacteria bacterium]
MERLQRVVARASVASRRHAEELIRSGQVTVNGKVQIDPTFIVEIPRDHIKIGGKSIKRPVPLRYFLLYKPRGVVSTVRDPQGRPTVIELIHGKKLGLFPVGRLDIDAEGLILLTSDGGLAHRLMHPRFNVPRTYHVKVRGVPTEKTQKLLKKGAYLGKGEWASSPLHITMLRPPRGPNSWWKVVLVEGKNREIKRMFKAIGHPVLKLRRVGFAFLRLKGLRPGKYRPLEPDEVQRLTVGRS